MLFGVTRNERLMLAAIVIVLAAVLWLFVR